MNIKTITEKRDLNEKFLKLNQKSLVLKICYL